MSFMLIFEHLYIVLLAALLSIWVLLRLRKSPEWQRG